MSIEDEVLFYIYKLEKERKKECVSIGSFNVPFEAIKEHFSDTPESKLESIVSDLYKKSWISGEESKTVREFTTDSFVPGKFGAVKLHVAPDGLDRISEIINQH